MRIKVITLLILIIITLLPTTTSAYADTQNTFYGGYTGTAKIVYRYQDFITGRRVAGVLERRTWFPIYIDIKNGIVSVGFPLPIQHICVASKWIHVRARKQFTYRYGDYISKEWVVLDVLIYGKDYSKCKISYIYLFNERNIHTWKTTCTFSRRITFLGERFY